MKTKTYDMKKLSKWRFLLSAIFLISAITLAILKPNYQIGQLQIANSLTIAGIVLLLLGIKGFFFGEKIKYDERNQIITLKSSKATLTTLIYIAITLMLIGTIQNITTTLLFTSSAALFTTIIIYKIFYWHFNKTS